MVPAALEMHFLLVLSRNEIEPRCDRQGVEVELLDLIGKVPPTLSARTQGLHECVIELVGIGIRIAQIL